jgi:hypothetical protein
MIASALAAWTDRVAKREVLIKPDSAVRGDAIARDAVGPDPVKTLKSKVIVVGVNVTWAALLGGALRSGDLIQLVAAGGNGHPTSLEAVVLSSVQGQCRRKGLGARRGP